MAINFEAANMAGYNNPKIEVFEARTNDMFEIVFAPKKSEIVNSITRGCIPFILLIKDSDGVASHFLLRFEGSQVVLGGSALSFSAVLTFGTLDNLQSIVLTYPPNDELPHIAT